MKTSNPVDLIVPVYDGYEETRACIESLIQARQACSVPSSIILINDCSPNPELSSYMKEIASGGEVELHVNDKNLGFVATVNRGMKLNPGHDVVLVNSDTLVANDWLDRMHACAYLRDNIATVTPFSNNAEICSFPSLCKSNELISGVDVQQQDQVFSRQPCDGSITMPTAVGFAMYIKRSALDKVGYFDEEAFGRGYGEENDFCLRCSAVGLDHVLATNVFVFHEGGVSFSDEKLERVENALKILDRKYPSYHREVHEHIELNPASSIRQKVQLEMLLNNGRPKILYVTHHMGGGIQAHIEENQEFFGAGLDIVLLRPSEEADVELCYQHSGFDFSLHFNLESDKTFFLKVLRELSFARVHFHHLMRVPEQIWSISQVLNLPYDVTLHDYYFINANPTLTGPDGRYVEALDEREEKCGAAYPIPDAMTLNQWHQKMKNFLMGAARVIAPSQACADIYQLYFRELSIQVAFHADAEEIIRYPDITVPKISETDKIRVAVIGAISREKGADILEHTACHKDPMDRLEFHLIGYAYKPLRETVEQHGAYRKGELLEKINEVKPHIVWFPAQWPETYCYVLSEAMIAGLPVLAPHIGSFPERLQGRPASFIKPWSLSPEDWKNSLIEIREWMIAHSGQVMSWENTAFGVSGWRYPQDYLPDVELAQSGEYKSVELGELTGLCKEKIAGQLSRKEALLRVLLRVREWPVVRTLLRLVPFQLQRKLKRMLSHRAVHDIVND
jgi:GT2 family glycosyltransferase